MKKSLLFFVMLTLATQITTQAAERPLLGATQFLQRVEAAAAPEAAASIKVTPLQRLGKDLADYRVKQASLKPEVAAADWLDLYDRFLALPQSGNNPFEAESPDKPAATPTIQTLLNAMPGPDAWPFLSTLIGQRPPEKGPKALRNGTRQILFSLLNGNPTNLLADANALDAALKTRSGQNSSSSQQWPSLKQKLMHSAASGTNLVNDFQQLLVDLKKLNNTEATEVKAPDLVALAGPAEASRLLLEALTQPRIRLTITEGGETRKLAQSLALQHVSELKEPQWELISSLDQTELYEAMAKQFPQKKNSESSEVLSPFVSGFRGSSYSYWNSEQNRYRQQATIYYMLGLLNQKRSDEAVKVVCANFASADLSSYYWFSFKWTRVESMIPRTVLYEFLKQALHGNPELPFWDEYARLALLEGKSEEAAAALKTQLAEKKGTLLQQARLTTQLAHIYFSADQVEAGLACLMQIPEFSLNGESAADQSNLRSEQIKAAIEITTLGKVMNRKEWTEQGLALALKLSQKAADQNAGGRYNADNSLINLLIEYGHYADAEAILLRAIEAKIEKSKTQDPQARRYQDFDDPFSMELMLLARLYNQAGRHADVLYLMEKYPWWAVDDLKALTENGCDGKPLTVIVAEALIDAGRKEEAMRILKYAVEQNPSNDKVYEPLMGISSSELLPWLDNQYQMDRLEERPLIWKAALLLKIGKLDEAEAVAREALKVDPTDGEQPAGDRVRGYGVLSDILKAKSNLKESEFFAKVVQSVRIAEHGDALTHSMLIKRSLALYEEAASLFADAYCVQWRLGERLNALGRTEEAEKHYELAFARMPEQFGQVASLCFGCEGVFQSQSSRGAADRILSRMEKAGSPRPQVYFLLGELREAEERFSDAYHYYQRSVELDPAYLDGWKHLAELTDSLFIPAAERDRITLHMLQLDPLQRHSYSGSLDKIMDFKGLWTVLEANRHPDPKVPPELFVLTAARARHEKEKSRNQGAMGYRHFSYQRNQASSWGAILKSHALIQGLLNLQQEGQFQSSDSF